MKITFELPDPLYQQTQAAATHSGQTLEPFIASAVEAALGADKIPGREKPWMEFAGIFQGDPEESKRVLQTIEDACGRVSF